ncbi:MAG: NADH:ubiquinone reductase (Na(+)-transporting) subunit A, partial [Bacteroidetes bacterium]|nr:NADH:ubiquinone reductase (Na(+)-transporting) subunit A [Bacteroidota bacterium]
TLDGENNAFQMGINALAKLTDRKVHLGMNARSKKVSTVFENVGGVKKHWFHGKHPAGNVGIQIHHVQPIKKGDIVWTISPVHVVMIGKLFLEGRLNTEMIVAVAGS